jgi:hypothetical protein
MRKKKTAADATKTMRVWHRQPRGSPRKTQARGEPGSFSDRDLQRYRLRLRPLGRTAMRNRDLKGFRVGGRSRGHYATPADTLDTMVPRTGATRTTLGFGICPSFKGHSLSRRAKP